MNVKVIERCQEPLFLLVQFVFQLHFIMELGITNSFGIQDISNSKDYYQKLDEGAKYN